MSMVKNLALIYYIYAYAYFILFSLMHLLLPQAKDVALRCRKTKPV